MKPHAYVAVLKCDCGEQVFAEISEEQATGFIDGPHTADRFVDLLAPNDKITFLAFIATHHNHGMKKAIGGLIREPNEQAN